VPLTRDDETYALWGGGLAILLGLAVWKGKDAEIAVADLVGRGALLNHTFPVDGIVPDDPGFLLVDAQTNMGDPSVTADEYSIGRMGRSEGVNGMEYRMHVALNDLAELQRTYGTGIYSSVTALMLRSASHPEANGLYSSQDKGKRYATTRDPYAADVLLARKVLADRAGGIDLAQGATKFFDISSGGSGGSVTYEEALASWTAQGYTPFTVSGATDDFVLFSKTVSLAAAA
jgi:hypothetical protein